MSKRKVFKYYGVKCVFSNMILFTYSSLERAKEQCSQCNSITYELDGIDNGYEVVVLLKHDTPPVLKSAHSLKS